MLLYVVEPRYDRFPPPFVMSIFESLARSTQFEKSFLAPDTYLGILIYLLLLLMGVMLSNGMPGA